MATDETISSPADIFRLGTGFAMAKVVLTAVELELFTKLDDGEATEPEIRERLGLHPRGSRQWLDALVISGLLYRKDGRYGNGQAAARFLVRGKPSYVGGFLARSNEMLYPAWERFNVALRTGRPQANDGDYMKLIEDPELLARFLNMMDGVSGPLGPLVAQAFDWSSVKSVADIGGARGNMLSHVLRPHEHLTGTVFDLPPLEPQFREHMRKLGLTDRAGYSAGSFFDNDLPEAEVLIIGHVLHDWPADVNRMIVAKAFQAVAPGGALLVYDRMIEEEPVDADNLLVSLHMLLTTPGGAEYTPGECQEWLRAAGFADITAGPLGPTDTLVVGRKPA